MQKLIEAFQNEINIKGADPVWNHWSYGEYEALYDQSNEVCFKLIKYRHYEKEILEIINTDKRLNVRSGLSLNITQRGPNRKSNI